MTAQAVGSGAQLETQDKNSKRGAAKTPAALDQNQVSNEQSPGAVSEDDDVQMSGDDQVLRLDQDVALPKATITSMISEKLPADVKMANTSKDLIIQLSMAFISNLAAKANTICSDHDKKTIIADHVFEAMHAAKQTHLLGPILD